MKIYVMWKIQNSVEQRDNVEIVKLFNGTDYPLI